MSMQELYAELQLLKIKSSQATSQTETIDYAVAIMELQGSLINLLARELHLASLLPREKH